MPGSHHRLKTDLLGGAPKDLVAISDGDLQPPTPASFKSNGEEDPYLSCNKVNGWFAPGFLMLSCLSTNAYSR